MSLSLIDGEKTIFKSIFIFHYISTLHFSIFVFFSFCIFRFYYWPISLIFNFRFLYFFIFAFFQFSIFYFSFWVPISGNQLYFTKIISLLLASPKLPRDFLITRFSLCTCCIGTMPQFVQIETWFYGIIHCIIIFKIIIIQIYHLFENELDKHSNGYLRL